jgi:hypothetical protein
MSKFVNHEAMIAAAEREVREEARRHPDDPWRMKAGDTHEFAAAVADARKRLRNECLLVRHQQVVKAANVRDRYRAEGWPVPMWARNTLSWAAHPEKITSLYQFDDDGDVDLDNALSSLKAAVI